MAGSMGGFSFDAGGINQMLAQRQNQSQFLRKLLSDEMAQAAQARNAEQALALQRELGMGGLALDRDRFGLESELARGAMGLNRDRFGFEQEQGRAATGLAGRRLDLDALAGQREAWRDQKRAEMEMLGITKKEEQDLRLAELEKIELAQRAQKMEQEGAQFKRRLGFDQAALEKEIAQRELDRQNRLEAARIPVQGRLDEVAAAGQIEKDKIAIQRNAQDFLASKQFERAQQAAQSNPEIAKIVIGIIQPLFSSGDSTAVAEAISMAKTAFARLGFGEPDSTQRPNAIAGVMGGQPPFAPQAAPPQGPVFGAPPSQQRGHDGYIEPRKDKWTDIWSDADKKGGVSSGITSQLRDAVESEIQRYLAMSKDNETFADLPDVAVGVRKALAKYDDLMGKKGLTSFEQQQLAALEAFLPTALPFVKQPESGGQGTTRNVAWDISNTSYMPRPRGSWWTTTTPDMENFKAAATRLAKLGIPID